MTSRHTPHTRPRTEGFSLIELLVVVAIAFVIAAVAIPQALAAYRTYQLNNAATEVASILKFTRLEAIRLNQPVDFRSQTPAAGSTLVWADSAAPLNNNIADPTENQALLGASGNFVPIGGVPNTNAIAAAIGAPALVGQAPGAALIVFDQRGALQNPAVYAICIQNTGIPAAGYRAVIVMPSGSIQVWAADNGGNWHRTS